MSEEKEDQNNGKISKGRERGKEKEDREMERVKAGGGEKIEDKREGWGEGNTK